MGYKTVDEAVKKSLEHEISENELYAPEDLKNWLKKRETENRQTRYDLGSNEMKERKKSIPRSNGQVTKDGNKWSCPGLG
jgi:hypothetical protein